MEAYYNPCSVGLHVCGSQDIDGYDAAATVANFPVRSPDEARRVFAIAKAELAESGDDFDMVVDLNVGRDDLHVDDFPMRRQMLERLRTIVQTKTA